MLRLSRKRGEQVRIGDDLVLRVLKVRPHYILAELESTVPESDNKTGLRKIKPGLFVDVGKGVQVTLQKVFHGTASLVFDAPKDTVINREEIHFRIAHERQCKQKGRTSTLEAR